MKYHHYWPDGSGQRCGICDRPRGHHLHHPTWEDRMEMRGLSRDMEPPGGNLYRPHPLLESHGTYWRCRHGRTGYDRNMNWRGCWRCWVRLRAPVLVCRLRGRHSFEAWSREGDPSVLGRCRWCRQVYGEDL